MDKINLSDEIKRRSKEDGGKRVKDNEVNKEKIKEYLFELMFHKTKLINIIKRGIK